MLQNLNQIVENLAGSSIYTWLFAEMVGLGPNFLLFKGLIPGKGSQNKNKSEENWTPVRQNMSI